MQIFTIEQRLPGLNEYINALNINRYKGNALKREAQDAIGLAIKRARLEPVTEYPVFVFFEWHEKTKRRDLDNIASAKKFILDALQECGILDGDGQKQLVGFSDKFVIGDGWDGCVVTIYSVVAEERHGWWVSIPESEMTGFNPEFAGRDPVGSYVCSVCGEKATFSCNDEWILSDFCPFCGAKMDL